MVGSRPSLESLIGSTALLILLDIDGNEPEDLEKTKLLFLRVSAHWLIRLREVIDSVERNLPQVTQEIHDCAIQAIVLLRRLLETTKAENSTIHERIIYHLRLVTRVTTKKSHLWTEYLNKFVDGVDELWQEYTKNNLLSLVPRTDHAAAAGDRLSSKELRRLTCSFLSLIENSSAADLEKLVFSTNKTICMVQQILDRFPHESAVSHVSNTTLMQHQFDENVPSVLNALKGVLAKMRSLHTVCSYLEHARNDESENDDDFVASTSKRRRLRDSSKISTQCPLTVRTLLNSRNFEQFVGPSCTPAATPKTPCIENEWIVRLCNSNVTNKRVPWSVEESIALWHGVFHEPGRKNWAEIWRRSFRRSIRTQVHLKDRWRVMKKNPTVYEAIANAYQSWADEHKQVQPDGSFLFPVPVIIHS